jgi:ParB-like chromosome segregation protein Spo0J
MANERTTSEVGDSSEATLWPADQVERWPVGKLILNARNARTHSEAQVDQIAASIHEWGWTCPILVTEQGVVIAGHGRLRAAGKLGLTEIPVMVAKGWSKAQIQAYALADNKLALNAGWDADILALEIAELQEIGFDVDLIGFDEAELIALASHGAGGLTDPDDIPAVPAEPISRTGDLWLMGLNRLLCGDSALAADVVNSDRGYSPSGSG